MLGDTAVAVHPDDPRYTHLHGKKLKHPFLDRQIPIITDAILVDMKFGTGAVKVTPAHDFNDFATGKRHGLEELNIFNLDGTVYAVGGEFAGLERFAARKAVKKRLAQLGLERGSKPHQMTLPRSERSGTIVEPIISTQWFVKMAPLAEPALAAVKDGRTKILPEDWVKTYDHWLGNIVDWCISRQLWWGHRVPAFHCKACAHIVVTREETVAKCEKCGSSDVEQDPDVLDTWFSSGLWPFSTMGWPDKTAALDRFYPSTDMSTGYDILFFWVARMMMMGLHFMGDVPFNRVLLNGLVVDETGEKMSKVKANSIDPLDLIHGAEFDDGRAEGVARRDRRRGVREIQAGVSVGRADGQRVPGVRRGRRAPGAVQLFAASAAHRALAEAHRRLSSLLQKGVQRRAFSPRQRRGREALRTPHRERRSCSSIGGSCRGSRARSKRASAGIDGFRLDEGSGALYHFFWDELCDWYLELTKPIFTSGAEDERIETRDTLAHAIETALRALHPYIPFVTEELWQHVPKPGVTPKDDRARALSDRHGRHSRRRRRSAT